MSQEQTAYSATDEVTSFLEKRTAWSRTKILLRKSPATARFGMIVIAIYILVAIFAPWIAPYGEAEFLRNLMHLGVANTFWAQTKLGAISIHA